MEASSCVCGRAGRMPHGTRFGVPYACLKKWQQRLRNSGMLLVCGSASWESGMLPLGVFGLLVYFSQAQTVQCGLVFAAYTL